MVCVSATVIVVVVVVLMLLLRVSAHVLAALVKWGTPEGAAELMMRPGTLISQAFKETTKDNEVMVAISAPHGTDDQAREMLQACCMLGVVGRSYPTPPPRLPRRPIHPIQDSPLGDPATA